MIIKYNADGWVCDRYPYDLKNYAGELEVDDSIGARTYCSAPHFAWRVVNGEVVNERYEETPRREWAESRIRALKRLLTESDYKAIKFSEGVMTEQEYAPIRTQRAAWRAEINELEQELQG